MGIGRAHGISAYNIASRLLNLRAPWLDFRRNLAISNFMQNGSYRQCCRLPRSYILCFRRDPPVANSAELPLIAQRGGALVQLTRCQCGCKLVSVVFDAYIEHLINSWDQAFRPSRSPSAICFCYQCRRKLIRIPTWCHYRSCVIAPHVSWLVFNLSKAPECFVLSPLSWTMRSAAETRFWCPSCPLPWTWYMHRIYRGPRPLQLTVIVR